MSEEINSPLLTLVREQGLEALWEAMRPTLLSRHAPAELLERARGWVLEQDQEDVVRAPGASDWARAPTVSSPATRSGASRSTW